MIPGLKKPISVSSSGPLTLHLRKAFLPAAIVLMALAFSCTRQSEANDAVDRSTIKIGYFGDLTGPTFNFGQSAIQRRADGRLRDQSTPAESTAAGSTSSSKTIKAVRKRRHD